jgi:hypothetical protein
MTGRYEFRLHIGAHKTATTNLQDVLAARSGLLLQGGCTYLSRRFMRKSGLVKAVYENYWSMLRPWEKRLSLEEFLTLPEGHPKRLLISEEDVLGMSINLLHGIYPEAKRWLLPWASIVDPKKAHIFLSGRDYASILPSAYSQALRDGAIPRVFSAYRDDWITHQPSWVDLIQTICALFSGSRVTVWTMEHYLESPAAIFKAVSGVELPDGVMEAPRETRLLSASAIRKIEQLDGAVTGKARWQTVQALIAADDSTELFDPLSAREKALLSERYRQDIQRIKQLPVEFLG